MLIRPTVGTVAFFIIGKSWSRIGMLICILVTLTLYLLGRSKHSITLQYLRPEVNPSPLIMVTHPQASSVTVEECCSVEAALRDSQLLLNRRQTDSKRKVYFYVWSKDVHLSDTWLRFLRTFPGVTVSHVDEAKTVQKTPFATTNPKKWDSVPVWSRWWLAGISLLYKSGGTLMPSGTIVQTPFSLDPLDDENVFVATTANGTISAAGLGLTMKHPLLGAIFERLIPNVPSNYASLTVEDFYIQLAHILDGAFLEYCYIDSLSEIQESNCVNFRQYRETPFNPLANYTSFTKARLFGRGTFVILRKEMLRNWSFFLSLCPQTAHRWKELGAKDTL